VRHHTHTAPHPQRHRLRHAWPVDTPEKRSQHVPPGQQTIRTQRRSNPLTRLQRDHGNQAATTRATFSPQSTPAHTCQHNRPSHSQRTHHTPQQGTAPGRLGRHCDRTPAHGASVTRSSRSPPLRTQHTPKPAHRASTRASTPCQHTQGHTAPKGAATNPKHTMEISKNNPKPNPTTGVRRVRPGDTRSPKEPGHNAPESPWQPR
jgi:hypothetical protein